MNRENFWYIASYPKSGNTWCRLFIQQVIHLKNYFDLTGKINLDDINDLLINIGSIASSRDWIDDQLGVDSRLLNMKEIELARRKIGLSSPTFADSFRYHKIHDFFYGHYSKKPIVPIERCSGIVYLIRHPVDIAISMKHFFLWDIDSSVNFLMNNNAYLNVDNHGQQVSQFLGSWDMHVESWTSQSCTPILLLRYEDLIYKSESSFTKLSKFLNITNEKKIISKAIQDTNFFKLKKIEEKKGFREKPQHTDSFFRSGKVGDGFEILSSDQIKKLENKFKLVLERFNYL